MSKKRPPGKKAKQSRVRRSRPPRPQKPTPAELLLNIEALRASVLFLLGQLSGEGQKLLVAVVTNMPHQNIPRLFPGTTAPNNTPQTHHMHWVKSILASNAKQAMRGPFGPMGNYAFNATDQKVLDEILDRLVPGMYVQCYDLIEQQMHHSSGGPPTSHSY